MPRARKTRSIGAPTRREISPARMLKSPSAPPSRISSCALAIAAGPRAVSPGPVISGASSVIAHPGRGTRETACHACHNANPRGDARNAYTKVNRDRPALGSFSDLVGLGQPGGCPEAEPDSNQRRPAGLPRRLPDLLLKCADGGLHVAGMPEAECAKPFGAVPAGGSRTGQSGASRPGNYRAGHRGAGAGCTSRPDLWAADVAATGGD